MNESHIERRDKKKRNSLDLTNRMYEQT